MTDSPMDRVEAGVRERQAAQIKKLQAERDEAIRKRVEAEREGGQWLNQSLKMERERDIARDDLTALRQQFDTLSQEQRGLLLGYLDRQQGKALEENPYNEQDQDIAHQYWDKGWEWRNTHEENQTLIHERNGVRETVREFRVWLSMNLDGFGFVKREGWEPLQDKVWEFFEQRCHWLYERNQ